MDLGKLYESMAKDGQESSHSTSTDGKNTSASGSSEVPVMVSHRQFHGPVCTKTTIGKDRE